MIIFHPSFSIFFFLYLFPFSLLVVVVDVVSFFLYFFLFFLPLYLFCHTYKSNGRLLELFHRDFELSSLLLKTSGLT